MASCYTEGPWALGRCVSTCHTGQFPDTLLTWWLDFLSLFGGAVTVWAYFGPQLVRLWGCLGHGLMLVVWGGRGIENRF